MSEAGMMPKIEMILHSAKYNGIGPVKFKAFCIDVKNPEIVLNGKNGMPQSKTVTKYKNALRSRFKDKVYDYQYDTIVHITDNYIQSRALELLLNMNYDLTELFERLSPLHYAIIKMESDHQHERFPSAFLPGRDVDILTDAENFLAVSDCIKDYLKQRFLNQKEFTLSCAVKGIHNWIEVQLFGKCLVLFDVVTALPKIKEEYVGNMLLNTEFNRNCKVPRKKDECLIRISDLMDHPNKKWHMDYLKNNYQYVDRTDVEEYFAAESLPGALSVYQAGRGER